MKYSILGFNQEIVCAIKKDVQTDNGNIKHLCLDVIDLLILKDVSDFMNRSKIIKLTIDDKIYFSITHKCILEDLPILGIKKQALKDRIDKMVQLGILDKKVVRDNGGTWVGYRTTKVYEDLIYSNNNQDGVYLTTRGGCSELHEGGVVNYNPNNTITINNSTINNKEEDIIISSKKNDYQAIVDCWNEHNGKKLGKVTKVTERRKKAIKKALDDNGITQEQLMLFFKTLPLADKWLYNPNKQHANWKPDFDWWLSNPNGWLTKGLEGKVHLENPQAYSSIMLGKDAPYTPICDGALSWNEYYNCYMYVGYWDGKHIPDGYDDDTRPDGASVTLNNGRGTITWDKNTKQWEKV